MRENTNSPLRFVIGNDSTYNLLYEKMIKNGYLRPTCRYVLLFHFHIITVDGFVASFLHHVVCIFCIVLQDSMFVLMCCHLLCHLVLLCADLEKHN